VRVNFNTFAIHYYAINILHSWYLTIDKILFINGSWMSVPMSHCVSVQSQFLTKLGGGNSTGPSTEPPVAVPRPH